MKSFKDFKITNKVPVPAFPGKTEYPFKDMEVGDMFPFPKRQPLAQNIRSSSHAHGKTYGKKFTVRSMSDTTMGCWRIK